MSRQQAQQTKPRSITGLRVKLVGEDGNAYAILGTVVKAMRRAKIDQLVVDEYKRQATSGDYDHLLQVTMQYVEVE